MGRCRPLIACSTFLVFTTFTGCSLSPDRGVASHPSALSETKPSPAAPRVAPAAAATSGKTAGAAVAPNQTAPPQAPAPRAAAATPPPHPAAPEAVPMSLRGVPAPAWHVGDQWSFRWESAQGQGEYVWTVARIEALDGVPHYVVASGPREIYFRVRDLATSLETKSGAAELRHTPARMSYSWPLTPGTMWRQSLTEDKPGERAERTIAWTIEGEERVRIDAGAFDTLKIVARHDHYKSAIMYEMWYAPEARQWVRLKEHFPSGTRYRELTDLALAQ